MYEKFDNLPLSIIQDEYLGGSADEIIRKEAPLEAKATFIENDNEPNTRKGISVSNSREFRKDKGPILCSDPT